MWDKSNCSVIYTLFKIIFLGKWGERTERPFQFPRSPHTFCAFCPALSLLLLWIVLLGLYQECGFVTCCLTDGTSNLWTTWWRLLLPIFLFIFHSSSWYKSSQYLFHLFAICVASVKFSPVADWIHCRSGWNFRVIDLTIWKSCLEFPFEFAASSSTHMPSRLSAGAVYPLRAFSVPQPRVLDIVSYLCLLHPYFPWLLRKSHQISISFYR